MKVIVISDDRYFSMGAYYILEGSHSVFIHDENSAKLINFNYVHNAVVLISVNSSMLFLDIVCNINQLTNRVFVVTENNRCTRMQSASIYQLVNKRLSAIMLNRMVSEVDVLCFPKISLSERERKILHLILNGMSSNRISIELDISIKTVSSHRVNALRKLGLKKINQIGDLSKIYN